MGNSLQIEHVAPDSLVPAAYNPRAMTAEARKRLRRGIETFGLVDPIIARRADAMVIGGHQRLHIALDMKLETVPVVFLDDITDAQAATLNVLLNNQAAAGEWDFAMLTELLSNLDAEGFDATLTGFSEKDLKDILGATWEQTEATGGDSMLTDDEASLGRAVTIKAEAMEMEQIVEALPAFLAQWPTAEWK